ncbi:hypothetical protein ACFX1Z_028943 [Malus domestica]
MIRTTLSNAKAITNLIHQGQNRQAIALFQPVCKNGFKTTVSSLSNCSSSRKNFCNQRRQSVSQRRDNLMTSLLDMYSKCNRIKVARLLFDA